VGAGAFFSGIGGRGLPISGTLIVTWPHGLASLPTEIPREDTEMNSTPSRTQSQIQREQLETLHAQCEQVRHESRAVIVRARPS
jgi:hypothetical protein